MAGLDREMLVAKFFYFFYSGSQVFLMPYLSLYLQQDLAWEPWRVGLVQGLRPWVAAPCALLLCALADRLRIHRALMLACFATSVALRASLGLLPPGVADVAAVLLLSEAIASPVGVLVDASVVAKCTRDDGAYGRQRVWASIGWGGLSPAAGLLITRMGIHAGMLVYACMSLPNLFAAWLLAPGSQQQREPRLQAAAAGSRAGAATAHVNSNAGREPKASGGGKDADVSVVAAVLNTTSAGAAGSAALAQPALVAQPAPAAAAGDAALQRHQPHSPPLRRALLPCAMRSSVVPDADGMLRVRLLDAAARSPSPALSSPGTSPVRGGRCSFAPPSPLALASAGGAAGRLLPAAIECGASSCCSTPRSTAALLPADALLSDAPCPEGSNAGCDEPPAEEQCRGAAPAAGAVEGAAAGEFEGCAAGNPVAPAPRAAAVCASGDGGSATQSDRAADGEAAEAAARGDALAFVRLGGIAGDKVPKAQQQPESSAPIAANDTSTDEAAGCCDRHTAAGKGCDAGGPAPAPGGVAALLVKPGVPGFLLRALFIGFGLGTQGSFAFLLVQQLGGTPLLMSMMLVFSILTEAPAFQFQAQLLACAPVSVVMNASMLLLALRLGCYALLPRAHTPWLVLPVELLHGCTFATSWGAGIVAAKRLAAPHLNTTMQSIFSGLYGGAGSGLGAILGGLAMQRVGAPSMFAIAAATVLAGCMLALAVDLATGVRLAGAGEAAPAPSASNASASSAGTTTCTCAAAADANGASGAAQRASDS